MKVAIVGGAGTIGATAAFVLVQKPFCDEVRLIDAQQNALKNHWMDMQNAFADLKTARLAACEWDGLQGADVVLLCAGAPNRQVQSRREFLQENLRILQTIGPHLRTYSPDALLVTVTNPVDVLNYCLHKAFSFPREQLIGYSYNDCKRFQWAIRSVLSLSPADEVFSPVLGEHGEAQVPLFSQVTINGQPAVIGEAERKAIREKIARWFVEFNELGVNRTTGWTTAVGIGQMLELIAQGQERLFIGSAVLCGEYGLHDISLGVPLLLQGKGVKGVIEWPLTEEEWQELHQSAGQMRRLIAETENYFV